jgi:hypothetical protein
LRRPSLDLAVAFNHSIRESDEWFDEPDDRDRVGAALAAAGGIEDPIEVAATVAYRVARAQGFSEGNKRTAMLLAKWTLDRNGIEGERIIPPRDREARRSARQGRSGPGRRDTDLGALPKQTGTMSPTAA